MWNYDISGSAFLTPSYVQGCVCIVLVPLKAGSSGPLHVAARPEISTCSNTLSLNVPVERELAVSGGTALFFNNQKHYFLSRVLGCFRALLVRNAAALPRPYLGWSPVVKFSEASKAVPISFRVLDVHVTSRFALVTQSLPGSL